MIEQYLLSGITTGAIYALVALGFAIIYNASHVINFAQGEFVMIGGMATAAFFEAGLPLPLAVVLSIGTATLVGVLLEKLAVEPARDASVVTLIIITIGASILLRGLATLVWDKKIHRVPAFSGEAPIAIGSATLLPQVLWVLGVSAVAVARLVVLPPHAHRQGDHRRLAQPPRRSSWESACAACSRCRSACRPRSARSPGC